MEAKVDLYVNGASNTNGIPDQQVMTWNYDGNVGIGTTGPNSKLQVVAGDGVAAIYSTATNSYGVYGYSASSYGVYANAAGSSAALYAVQTTGTAVQGTVIGAGTGMAGYFNQGGTLTGNATNPATYVLRNQVLGAYTSTGAILKLEDTTASTGNLLELIKQGSTKVVVDSTGNVGIGTTGPGINSKSSVMVMFPLP